MRIFANQLAKNIALTTQRAFLLHGNDAAHVMLSAHAIIAQKKAQGEQVVVFTADDDPNDYIAEYKNTSLFVSQRCLFVHSTDSALKAPWVNALLSFFQGESTQCSVLVCTPYLDTKAGNAAWVKAFDNRGLVVAHTAMDAYRFKQWLHGYASEHGITLSPASLQQLAAFSEGNVSNAVNTIQVLASGNFTAPTPADITAMSMQDSMSSTFDCVDAALNGDAKQALAHFANLPKTPGTDIALLWAMARALAVVSQLLSQVSSIGFDRAWQNVRGAGIWDKKKPIYHNACTRFQWSVAHCEAFCINTGIAERTAKGIIDGNASQKVVTLLCRLAGR